MQSIVSDTGPLITLEKMKHGFQFIQQLYHKIIIPSSVFHELTEKSPYQDDYLKHFDIEKNNEIHTVKTNPSLYLKNLHTGEAEAIFYLNQLLLANRINQKVLNSIIPLLKK